MPLLLIAGLASSRPRFEDAGSRQGAHGWRLKGSRALLLTLVAMVLLALAPAHASGEENVQTVRVHFHRQNHDYLGWGLYVWGAGLKLPRSVTWDRPLEPTGVDAFGVYFDVGVAPATTSFNFILHRGEEKAWPEDMAVDLVQQGREVWVMEGSATVHKSVPETKGAFELGVEADRKRRSTRQMLVGGAVLALVVVGGLVWFGVQLMRHRMVRTSEELAQHVKLLMQAQTDLREQGERLRASAADELTGLPTRGGVLQALEHAIARAEREGHCVAVMFVDLDGFKAVNDGAGHDAGDAVLRAIALRLRQCMRHSDVTGRVGGDEFVVVAEAPTNALQAFRLGRKLVRAAAEPVLFGGGSHQVGASVGVALYPDDGQDAASLWKAADTAMYAAKRAGKGACRLQASDRQAQVERQLLLENSLRAALQADAMELRFQPLFDLTGQHVVGHAATLHWVHDAQLQDVLPVLEMADDPALTAVTDRWLLTHAARAAASWPMGEPLPTLLLTLGAASQAMNATEDPAQAPNWLDLPTRVRNVLAEEGLPPQRLMLLFPARLLADQHRPLDQLLRLRAQGVRIGFNGAGEHELQLQRLIDAPIDLLVVEAPAAHHGGGNSALVRALAAIGAQCGYRLAASGLNTAEQRRWALAAGCTWGLGDAGEVDSR